MIHLGDRQKAKGMMLEAITLAQEYWFPNKKNIPEKIFENYGLKELIDFGLAKKTKDGIYLRGSKDHFQWWFKGIEQRREAGKLRAKTGERGPSGRWLPVDKNPAQSSAIQPSSSSSSSSSKEKNTYTSACKEILEYFNEKCHKKYTLTSSRKTTISSCLKGGRSVEDIKVAIYNFSKDDWEGRHGFIDIVYAIGVRNKIDNFDRWFNEKPKGRRIVKV